MSDLICPFSTPLVKDDFGCANAREIIRRGGAEIACEQLTAHTVCSGLHNNIKVAALASMDLEDDLLSLPHNVLVKIQYGGLLGLQSVTLESAENREHVENIVSLVEQAKLKFISVDNIPLEPISETISNFKIRRRRKK